MLEALLPEVAITLHPSSRFREWLGLEPARPALRVAAFRNQARALQYLEVLGDGGLADREGFGKLQYGCLADGEAGQDRPPCWVGERRKSCIEPLRGIRHRIVL